MAQVPFAHVESPRVINIGGVRAYNPGDPVPLDVAERLGLLGKDDSPEIIGGSEAVRERFVDGVITVTDPDAPTTDATADPAVPPTPPAGDATTVTPPQAPAGGPKQGRTSTTPTP